MSHSTCMVLLPREPRDQGDLLDLLGDLLEPFDENKDVEPYRSYVGALPENWQQTIANGERFDDLMASGLDRQAAWKAVWGERNDDPLIPWELSSAIRAGVDPLDLHAVAAHVSDEDDKYEVDDEGLYSWSTYNPQSKWDWWTLGGRWMGYFQVAADAVAYLGHPGTFDNEAPTALGAKPSDACRKGDIAVDAMQLAAAQQYGESYDRAAEYTDEGQRQFLYGIEPGESREAYILRRTNPDTLLRTYAVLAEGAWREPGRMGWFGVSHADDQDREKYEDWFARFWAAMPDETWVAVCDLHI